MRISIGSCTEDFSDITISIHDADEKPVYGGVIGPPEAEDLLKRLLLDIGKNNPYVYIIPLHATRPEFDEIPEEIETHVVVASVGE